MSNPIEINASSITNLLGEIQSSKSKLLINSIQSSKVKDQDEYDLSRFNKSSSILHSSKSKLISNKTIQHRIQNDQIESKFKISKSKKISPTIDDQLVNDALTRKALIYEATIQGKSGGLSEIQLESSTLNIDAKRLENQSILIPNSDPIPKINSFKGKLNSNLNEEKEEEKEEEWIESQDEFGRTTLIRLKDLPTIKSDPQRTMNFIQTESAQHLNEAEAQYGPQRSFPILDSIDRPIKSSSPIEKYFNPKSEQRQLGISHYNLSSNPIERKLQQDQLKSREIETQNQRLINQNQTDLIENSIQNRKRLIQQKREEFLHRKKSKTKQ